VLRRARAAGLNRAKSTADLWRRLLALTNAVILLVALSGLAAATAWTTHSCGLDEFFRTINRVNRVDASGCSPLSWSER